MEQQKLRLIIQGKLKHITFVMAMKEHFGTLPGQTLMDFAKELKALDQDDRAYFINELRTVGYDATKVS
jgi:hypothetical protein